MGTGSRMGPVGSYCSRRNQCSRHSGHHMRDSSLVRSLCDARLGALCI